MEAYATAQMKDKRERVWLFPAFGQRGDELKALIVIHQSIEDQRVDPLAIERRCRCGDRDWPGCSQSETRPCWDPAARHGSRRAQAVRPAQAAYAYVTWPRIAGRVAPVAAGHIAGQMMPGLPGQQRKGRGLLGLRRQAEFLARGQLASQRLQPSAPAWPSAYGCARRRQRRCNPRRCPSSSRCTNRL